MTDQKPSDPPPLGERLAAKCEQIAQQVRIRKRQGGLEVVRNDDWRDR